MIYGLLAWAKAHKDWATAIVMIVGLLLFSVIARMQGCTIHRADDRFDKAESVKLEEIARLQTEADAHNALALDLQSQVAALESEKQTLISDLATRDARIADLTRSRNAVQKQLEQDLRSADANISPLERCRSACDRAKRLGILEQTADCHCK